MSEPLKYMYNVEFFERLCAVLNEAVPEFNERRFIYDIFDTSWPDLELKQRTRKITMALSRCLPLEYCKAIDLVVLISKRLREREREQSYPFIFLPDFIELFGLDDFSLSMKAIEETTKLVSAEFAIRPFIIRYPKETMEYMYGWANHTDSAVRRLASEGCRPRLPWAMALSDFKNDPSPILPILERLKSDPSEYVRRSVANNLNDIAKDHPDLALKIAKKWKGTCPETDWIIKHGCRTLLKKGQQAILKLHGFNPDADAVVQKLAVTRNVAIGGTLAFSFRFTHRERSASRFRLEYSIDYLTQSGKISRKIFMISETVIEPNVVMNFNRNQCFKDFTTRKHHKGRHYIRILSNGKELAGCEFFVC